MPISPTAETFFVFNISDGTPLTGAAGGMSFDTYKDDTGTNLTPPTIFEIGGGAYGFSPTFTPGRGIVYVLSTGASGNPQKLSRYMRPEDYYADGIPSIAAIVADIQEFSEGRWKIFSDGPDANRMVFYRADGVTVLKKFDLLDADGNPAVFSPFERSPV